MKKQDIKSLTRKELIKRFENEGFPGFRAKQVFNWVYKNGVKNFNEMKNIPESFLKKMKEKFYMNDLIAKDIQSCADGTVKFLWDLADCNKIESVFIPFEDKRNSVCISSQVGCAMGCNYCATGLSGFKRNLTTGEIIDQILSIEHNINQKEMAAKRISNIVFMGMGEPLANFDAVLKAVKIINDNKGLNISMRRITISTSGLVPRIIDLADLGLPLVLAVSLNAPDDKLRNKLMPINKKYPLDQLLDATRYFINQTNRRVTFEYVLIRDLNDSPAFAYRTADLLNGILCHVNLIPLNPIKEIDFKRPARKTVSKFRKILEEKGIETTIRQERGTEINAACGQLRRLTDR